MPIATLKFKLPEEVEEFKQAVKAGAAHAALWDIGQELFRPARKHGYPTGAVHDALAACGELVGTELVSALEAEFYRIINKYDIEL